LNKKSNVLLTDGIGCLDLDSVNVTLVSY